nr:MAG TPA: hypothetical protein [Caudoviricetes sp.]
MQLSKLHFTSSTINISKTFQTENLILEYMGGTFTSRKITSPI